jgi:hypothetical protein
MAQSGPSLLCRSEPSAPRAVRRPVALLLAALIQADPCRDAFRALLRLRDASSSPADRGREVVAFLSARWSELSREEIDGVKIGDFIGRELDRVSSLQREDGLFYPDDASANAWTALALTEACDLTGLKRWERPARRAAAAIQGMPACDEAGLFDQYRVRVSADIAGLLDKGVEPAPFSDPLRSAVVAGWWGREVDVPLPADLDRASAETLHLADQAVSLGKKGPYSHGSWGRRVIEIWSRRPEPTDLGSAAFRAMALIPCGCFGCRSPFRKD